MLEITVESMLVHLVYHIFTTKFNNSSILITIISWDYLNLSLANGYVGDASNIISVAPGASANQIAVGRNIQ
jgi:hypothetical protein